MAVVMAPLACPCVWRGDRVYREFGTRTRHLLHKKTTTAIRGVPCADRGPEQPQRSLRLFNRWRIIGSGWTRAELDFWYAAKYGGDRDRSARQRRSVACSRRMRW